MILEDEFVIYFVLISAVKHSLYVTANSFSRILFSVFHHHHHVPEGLGLFPVP